MTQQLSGKENPPYGCLDILPYRFGHAILFDDTEGYFVVGGGKFIQGAEGYFGPVVYNRNRISPPKKVKI